MKQAAIDTWRFTRRHWPHLVVAVPMVIGVTALHEAAHALAVVIQGGTLLEFSVVPAADLSRWGYITYEHGPPGFSNFAVSVAPYLMWSGAMLGSVLLTLASGRWPFALASTIFVWGYLVPFGDIVNAWAAWVGGGDNDLRHAFGAPGRADALLLVAACGIVFAVGYPLQRRLYGDAALPRIGYAAYGLLALLAGAATTL